MFNRLSRELYYNELRKHRGKFRISREFLEHHPDRVLKLLDGFIPYRVEMSFEDDA